MERSARPSERREVPVARAAGVVPADAERVEAAARRLGEREPAISNDKRRARLNLITHLLSKIPYKKAPREKVKLPKRGKRHGYREPDYPYKRVPEKF